MDQKATVGGKKIKNRERQLGNLKDIRISYIQLSWLYSSIIKSLEFIRAHFIPTDNKHTVTDKWQVQLLKASCGVTMSNTHVETHFMSNWSGWFLFRRINNLVVEHQSLPAWRMTTEWCHCGRIFSSNLGLNLCYCMHRLILWEDNKSSCDICFLFEPLNVYSV